jgi:Sec-independent protein secretion pathway component TatC
MDALNLAIQVSLVGGAILASPFILYQVWLFIAPGALPERAALRGPLHGGHRGTVS